MRAVIVNEETLPKLKQEVSRQLFRQLKGNLESAPERGVVIYYIPEYEFPAAAGIPREHVVDDAFLHRYFEVPAVRDGMVWLSITPKKQFSLDAQSLAELYSRQEPVL